MRTLRKQLVGLVLAAGVTGALAQAGPDLAPMPEVKPGNAAMIELGKFFFFDNRISGDWGVSCASCHDPAKGWGDGQALSTGYPSMEYFRNAPTVINTPIPKRYLWDGRLDGSDAGTLVRDMITETHTMNMDSRLMQERLKQVPEYNALWAKWRKDDINGMRVYNVIAEFIADHPYHQRAFRQVQARRCQCFDRGAEAGLRGIQGQGRLRQSATTARSVLTATCTRPAYPSIRMS
jgi:cytochrome c peroxidase